MDTLLSERNKIFDKGYTVIEGIFNTQEIEQVQELIDKTDQSNPKFRKTADLFAIRQFLKEVPEVIPLIFKDQFANLITELFGTHYFVVKSIYFDKPERSNWFVAWHQDLTISVNTKSQISGYSNWTVKQDQFAAQPPIGILEDNFTVRIHLDDTDENNGALKVIPGSHLKGVYRPEKIDWNNETTDICSVKSGGLMIMRPLLMHASDRTTNNEKRRVIHIEFSRAKLPDAIDWSEMIEVKQSS